MNTCPVCGYKEGSPNKPLTHVMTQYRHDKTGRTIIHNSEDDKIQFANGDTYTKVGVSSDSPVEAKKVEAPPVETKANQPYKSVGTPTK
jgi:hypothetical protein